MDEKNILLKVLDIIGYQDNKENFINEFFSLIYAQTLGEMQTSLSEEQKNNFSREIEATSDEDLQRNIILKYFPKEKFDKKIQEITSSQFTDYLQTIYPTLNPDTEEKLTNFLNNLPDPKS